MTRLDKDIFEAICDNRSWAIDVVRERITPIIHNKIFFFEDWEDVRQQCLLDVVLSLRKIDRVENLWALIRKITVCRVIDYNRGYSVRREAIAEPKPSSEGGPAAGDGPRPDPSPSAEDRLADRDLFVYIHQRLSETCRQLFHLLFVNGASYSDAATELKITEGNLRVRLKRCRDKAISLRDKGLR